MTSIEAIIATAATAPYAGAFRELDAELRLLPPDAQAVRLAEVGRALGESYLARFRLWASIGS